MSDRRESSVAQGRDPRYGSDAYKLETAARGPVHTLDAGRYFAVVREGVPMIERADTAGAVLHVDARAWLLGACFGVGLTLIALVLIGTLT